MLLSRPRSQRLEPHDVNACVHHTKPGENGTLDSTDSASEEEHSGEGGGDQEEWPV